MAVIDNSVPRTFGEILGGLMGGVIDAQAQASRATIDFIEDVGTLEGAESDGTHNLRKISFNFQKKNAEDQITTFRLDLPLLSLVEIPAISIKTATFKFDYEVKTTEVIETEENNEGNETKKKWFQIRKPIKVIGTVKRESTSTSNVNAGISVNIEFEKSPTTLGMDRILDILELSANETEVKE